MKKTLKRLLSLVLVAALFISVVPMQAFAVEETEIYLPEIELRSDIWTTTSSTLRRLRPAFRKEAITLTCFA